MSKKGKITLIILLVTIILAAIGGTAYYLYQKDAPKRELAALGYNEQQTTVITKNNLADEVINAGQSSLFIYALENNISNIDCKDYYLLSDKDIPEGKTAKELFDVINKLKESGYTSEEAYVMVNNLDFETIYTVLRTVQPADLELFTTAIYHDYSVEDSLLLAQGNMELMNMLNEEKITFENVKPMLTKGYSAEEIIQLYNAMEPDDYAFIKSMKYIPELALLVGMDNFEMDKLPRYLMSLRSNRAELNDVINWVNNDNDYIPADEIDYSAMYHDEEIPENYASYTACINKQYALPADYVPSDLEQLPAGYRVLSHPMRHVAANAFMNMSDGSVVAGYERILAQSNYRSYEHQKSLYDEYVFQDGVALADTYSARPGHSEHQTGLVTDIGTSSLDMLYFENYSGYEWVLENAHRYGFIQRYPEGKEYITGYEYESWHFRYVGVESATVMYEHDWTLDEYSLLFD